jgi:hypothetical protein
MATKQRKQGIKVKSNIKAGKQTGRRIHDTVKITR